jgi:hypothetical protein
MSAAPKDSDGPTAGARTARLGQVWEAANRNGRINQPVVVQRDQRAVALAAAQMPKQFSGSTKRFDISPTSPSHRRTRSMLVASLCLVAVILIGGTSAVIAFRELPLADIWLDYISSWTQLHRPTSMMGSQQAIPRLRVQSSRGVAGEPVPLGLAIQGPVEGVVVIITGLLTGMEVSTGFEVGAHKWELLQEDVSYAFVVPPENFVGSVDLVAELRFDKIVDRQAIYLEWVPPSSPGLAENQHNREEAAETNPPVLASEPNLEKAAAPSSTSLAPKTLDQPEVTVSSSPPVLASERDLAKALAAIPSSSSLAPEPPDRQETAVSAGPPIASDRELQKLATAPSSPSFEQSHADQKVSTALPRIAQKQVDREEAAGAVRTPIFAQRQVDQEEIAVLLKRGKELLANGDVSAARITLNRAADANDVEAALALASTYDPFVLRELKVYSFPADAATARAWYEKAKELGSAVAPRRLEILARGAR